MGTYKAGRTELVLVGVRTADMNATERVRAE